MLLMSLIERAFLAAAPVLVDLEFKISSDDRALFGCHSDPNNDFQIVTDEDTGWGFLISSPSAENPVKKTKVCRAKALDPLSLLPLHVDRNFLKFPFFTDPPTFRHINSEKSKVLFIMRGMSGSGKSTIVNLFNNSFDASKLVVCSADHFFCGSDGVYRFDERLLGAAHTECQQKAKQACRAKTPAVVIDNTNVRRWEMKFYLDLSNKLGYVTVLVQPKTPWRMDADELARRTTHNVPLDVLRRKVKSFDDVIPSYYGWFCSEEKSAGLLHLSHRLFKECLAAFPDFRQDLLAMLNIKAWTVDEETTSGILDKYYTRDSRSGPLLHCTAKFCARGKVPGSANYHQREEVREAYGRVFQITVAGLVFTPRTMAARVTLGAEAATLFDKPEEVEWGSPSQSHGSEGPRSKSGRKAADVKGMKMMKKGAKKALAKAERKMRRKAKLSARWDDDEEDEAVDDWNDEHGTGNSLDEGDSLIRENSGMGEDSFSSSSFDCSSLSSALPEEADNDISAAAAQSRSGDFQQKHSLKGEGTSHRASSLSDRFPSLVYEGRARSAHLTLRTAQGVESREVNFDLLRTCDIEQDLARSGNTPPTLVPVSHGHARYYGNGLCCVYFDKPLTLKTIYSGHY